MTSISQVLRNLSASILGGSDNDVKKDDKKPKQEEKDHKDIYKMTPEEREKDNGLRLIKHIQDHVLGEKGQLSYIKENVGKVLEKLKGTKESIKDVKDKISDLIKKDAPENQLAAALAGISNLNKIPLLKDRFNKVDNSKDLIPQAKETMKDLAVSESEIEKIKDLVDKVTKYFHTSSKELEDLISKIQEQEDKDVPQDLKLELGLIRKVVNKFEAVSDMLEKPILMNLFPGVIKRDVRDIIPSGPVMPLKDRPTVKDIPVKRMPRREELDKKIFQINKESN